jgi:hypothetical protein
VHVIEEILAARVVDEHDGKAQLLGLRACACAQYARRRFLAGAEHLGAERAVRFVQQLDEVAAVVDDDVRRDLEREAHVAAHLIGRGAMARVDVQPFGRERRDHVVFRRFGIAACHGYGRTTGAQHEGQIRGFRFQVNAHGNALAGERPLGRELLLKLPQDRHVAPHPFDLALPLGRELGVGNDVVLHGRILGRVACVIVTQDAADA